MVNTLLSLSVLVALLLAVGATPAAPQQLGPPIDCGRSDGRERLTTEGFDVTFDAPVAKSYELVATNAHTRPFGAHRDATFSFTGDFAPYAAATLRVSLDWTEVGDFDVLVLDADGNTLAAANQRLVFEGPETLEVELAHCEDFSIVARTGPGHPGSTMTLDVDVVPGATLLACAENDPAPGCAGKAAGEAPALVADTRTRLYFSSELPGQAAMTAQYADSTRRGHLVKERPTVGTANTFTRPLTGNPDFGQYTLFFPSFFATVPEGTVIDGPVHALVWVSSTTMGADDKLYLNLFVDGAQVERVEVPGTALAGAGVPTAVSVTFAVPEAIEALESVGVQIASPRANDDPPNQVGQAEWTLFYGSVQFPSRLTL